MAPGRDYGARLPGVACHIACPDTLLANLVFSGDNTENPDHANFHPTSCRSRPGRSAICQPGRRSAAGCRPSGGGQRSALAGHAPKGWRPSSASTACCNRWPWSPASLAANVIARLKVQAELLTYRTDTPQEGRIRLGDGDVEMRLSTFPTLYGERAVVRLFGRARTVRAAGRSGPARRRAAGARGTARRDGRGDSRLGAGRQRQDDDRLRLPARTGRAGRRGAEPRLAGRSRSKSPCRALPNRKSIRRRDSIWPPACGSSCGKIRK